VAQLHGNREGTPGLVARAKECAERLVTDILWRLGLRARVFVGEDIPITKMKKGDFFYHAAQMRLYGPMPDEGEEWPITEVRGARGNRSANDTP